MTFKLSDASRLYNRCSGMEPPLAQLPCRGGLRRPAQGHMERQLIPSGMGVQATCTRPCGASGGL